MHRSTNTGDLHRKRDKKTRGHNMKSKTMEETTECTVSCKSTTQRHEEFRSVVPARLHRSFVSIHYMYEYRRDRGFPNGAGGIFFCLLKAETKHPGGKSATAGGIFSCPPLPGGGV